MRKISPRYGQFGEKNHIIHNILLSGNMTRSIHSPTCQSLYELVNKKFQVRLGYRGRCMARSRLETHQRENIRRKKCAMNCIRSQIWLHLVATSGATSSSRNNGDVSARAAWRRWKTDCHVMTLAVSRDTTIVDHFDLFRCAVFLAYAITPVNHLRSQARYMFGISIINIKSFDNDYRVNLLYRYPALTQ
jgi:hypothetical protein